MTKEPTERKRRWRDGWGALRARLAKSGGIAHGLVEICGRHPFAAGLLALLGAGGVVLSIVGFRLDRQEAASTTAQVRQVEAKIEEISAKSGMLSAQEEPVYRACDDQRVYRAVMDSARNLPEPYANWTVRGSSRIWSIGPGVCGMTVLFVTGDPSGRMTEVDVVYKTDVPVSSIRIHTTRSQEDECEKIVLSDELIATSITGEAEAEGYDCYYLATHANRTVSVSVDSGTGNVAASVVGVGDARDEFEFLTTRGQYEIRVFQLMRAPESERYALIVSVK